MKHKRLGFTIVELIITIVIIAILASITTIAYRETQKNARNETRKTDAMALMGAIEDYRADKGDFPTATCKSAPSSTANGCWNNEVWDILKTQGYLRDIPTPDAASSNSSLNIDGKANYGYRHHDSASYSIYISMEPATDSCYIGKSPKSLSGFSSDCGF